MKRSSLAETGRMLTWLGLYLFAAVLGRLTADPVTQLALVWPAAGIAALWLFTSNPRRLPFDLLAIGVATYLSTAATGAPPALAVTLTVANVVQPFLLVGLVALGSPGLLTRRSPSSLRDVLTVAVAGTAATGAGAAMGTGALQLMGRTADVGTLLLWWGRNDAGVLGLTFLGMLLLGRTDGVRHWRLRAPTARECGEAVLVVAVTALALWLVFGSAYETLPLGFLVLLCVVLVALRYSPVVVAAHSLAAGTACVVLTLVGHGPFAATPDSLRSALLVQAFVLVLGTTALVIAFSRHERDLVHADLLALQRETEERARLFAGVLAHMQEGIAVRDAEGNYLLANPASQPVTAQLVAAAQGSTDQSDGLHHLDGTLVQRHEMPSYRSANEGVSVREDYVLTPPGSDPIILEVTSAPLPLDDERTAAVVSFRDVTEARHDRDALAGFAGVVAHDLKRPLAVVSGWSDALADAFAEGEVDAATALPMLERVTGAADRMATLIDDLLHYTVVRNAPVQALEVDLSRIAREAAETFRMHESRPVITVQDDLRAVADPLLVRQVLDNLVGNAVKYVAPGVRPRVDVEGVEVDGQLLLRVSDNGIGVPAELRSRIFETFQRAGREDYVGTGLGLAIVRRAVERCGGRVSVHDHEGGGSAFIVQLPAVPGNAELLDEVLDMAGDEQVDGPASDPAMLAPA